MPGETALDSTMAIRHLNGDPAVVAEVTAPPIIVLPLIVVGELLFGAENSARPLENLIRYLQFIQGWNKGHRHLLRRNRRDRPDRSVAGKGRR